MLSQHSCMDRHGFQDLSRLSSLLQNHKSLYNSKAKNLSYYIFIYSHLRPRHGGCPACYWSAGEREAIKRNRKEGQFNIKLLPLSYTKGNHRFHDWTNKGRPPGTLTTGEATGLLLNKEAFLLQGTGPVGSHLVLCNETRRGTSAHRVSISRAATTSSQSRSRKKHLGLVMWRGGDTHAVDKSVQQNHLCRGQLGKA